MKNLILITQLGIQIMTPIFLCLLAGMGLEDRFGIDLILPLLLLGAGSGALNGYRLVKSAVDREKEKKETEEKAKRKQWKERYGTGDGKGRNKRQGW